MLNVVTRVLLIKSENGKKELKVSEVKTFSHSIFFKTYFA